MTWQCKPAVPQLQHVCVQDAHDTAAAAAQSAPPSSTTYQMIPIGPPSNPEKLQAETACNGWRRKQALQLLQQRQRRRSNTTLTFNREKIPKILQSNLPNCEQCPLPHKALQATAATAAAHVHVGRA